MDFAEVFARLVAAELDARHALTVRTWRFLAAVAAA
jgi:hypothetical protein